MSEPFILEYIPQRVKQLGFNLYHIRYRDMTILHGYPRMIPAYNELYFIIDNPEKIIVESDYGRYDTWNTAASDNEHQHRGEIIITNRTSDPLRIRFVQVILIN